MVTTAVPRTASRAPLPGSRYDHYFFSAMAAFCLLMVVIGFARTYFFAGVFAAPLPNRLIHLHGAAFSLWILFLVAQTSLVASGNTATHKRIGLAGFGLACVMVILGLLAAADSVHRNFTPSPKLLAQVFSIVPFTGIGEFAVLIYLAYRSRFQSAAHKRYIVIGTIAILEAALGRFPVHILQEVPLLQSVLLLSFILPLFVYDYYSTRRIHEATWTGFLLVTIVQFTRIPIGQTHAWQSFAHWVQSLNI